MRISRLPGIAVNPRATMARADDKPWRSIRLIAIESIHGKLYSPKSSMNKTSMVHL